MNRVLENGYICPNQMSICYPLPQWKYLVMKSYQQLPLKTKNNQSNHYNYNREYNNQSDIANYGHHYSMTPMRPWN
jgi:hypothetical protein